MRILLVDLDRDRTLALAETLRAAGYADVRLCPLSADIAATVAAAAPDVVLVDLDYPSRDVLDAMGDLSRSHPRPIVMFADRSDDDLTAEAIRAGVSAYVVADLTAASVRPVLAVAVARFKELEAMRAELEKSRADLAARKLIDRAKGILMQRKGLSEEDAYKMLRSLAMTQGKKLQAVAADLIAIAEVL